MYEFDKPPKEQLNAFIRLDRPFVVRLSILIVTKKPD